MKAKKQHPYFTPYILSQLTRFIRKAEGDIERAFLLAEEQYHWRKQYFNIPISDDHEDVVERMVKHGVCYVSGRDKSLVCY